MTIAEAQARRELAAFERFVQLGLLNVELGSVEKRPEPEPDLLCLVVGVGPVAFELAELCAEDVAKLMANSDQGFIWSADPSARILCNKLAKDYVTPHPIELLLHTEGRLVSTDNLIIETIRPILQSRGGGPFRHVWLLGEKGGYDVWHAG